jgi:hypothetical protein
MYLSNKANITLITFYYYPNKKIHYKTKLFYFSIKQFQTLLYFISRQSHFTLIQTNIIKLQPFVETSSKLWAMEYLSSSHQSFQVLN